MTRQLSLNLKIGAINPKGTNVAQQSDAIRDKAAGRCGDKPKGWMLRLAVHMKTKTIETYEAEIG